MRIRNLYKQGGILFLLIFFCISAEDNASAKLKGLQELNDGLIKVTKLVKPAVVSISVERKVSRGKRGPQFFFGLPFGPDPGFDSPQNPRYKAKSSGSGVIISKKGYVVTNNHVIANADSIKIILSNKKEYKCKIVGRDPGTDLAVLKISGKIPAKLPVVKFADSSKIKVGQIAIAIGNAFGFANTVTMGIVSAVGREGIGLADYEDFIQTDAAINPGNSGGALVDITGKVIGINTAIISKSGGYMGIGFAIPSNMVKNITSQLIKSGKVVRGWLGVNIQNLTADLAEKLGVKIKSGVIITDVMQGHPADKAGIKTGDIIVNVAGSPTPNYRELKIVIAGKKPGDKIDIVLYRKGKKVKLAVVIGNRIAGMSKKKNYSKSEQTNQLGLAVKDLNEQLSYHFKINDKNGVVIVLVKSGSAAYNAGLRQGDLIKEIDNVPVTNSNEFYNILKQKVKSKKILFLVKTAGMQRFVIVYK